MTGPAPGAAPPARPETVLEVLRAASGYLERCAVDAPRRSAETLLGHVLALPRLELYLAHDRPVSEPERAALRALVARRARHEPLQHLTGTVEFCGLSFASDARALVPRPETEGLVELARERAPANARTIDLGTGGGAIAVALARQRPDLVTVATDLSGGALALARANARAHGVTGRVHFVRSDWWSAFAPVRGFDLLVSNPPYVDPSRPETLADDVRRFEPHLALFTAAGDPASAYRAILAGLPEHVRAGGWLLLETGTGAAEPALALLRATPCLEEVELRADLAGLPRYLIGRVAG